MCPQQLDGPNRLRWACRMQTSRRLIHPVAPGCRCQSRIGIVKWPKDTAAEDPEEAGSIYITERRAVEKINPE
jgi:hypothetical protein